MTTRTRLAATLVAVAAVPVSLVPSTASAGRHQITANRTGVIQAIDAGGPDSTPGWIADDGYVGGQPTWGDSVSVRAGEAPLAVASTSRHGASFTYTLRRLTPGASYTVRLHFVDGWATTAGQRSMDVTANGATVLHDFDIVAASGSRDAQVHRDVTATADANGRIVLGFTGHNGDATVAGIEVIGALPPLLHGENPQVPGVKVVATGPSSTFLSWTTVPGVRQYAILRDGRVVGRTGEDAYVDGTAAPGHTYRYVVAAVDPDGTLGRRPRGALVTMPWSTPRATGAFHTQGTQIIDPNGKVFVPVGANIGSRFFFDGAGPSAGHAADAKAWGWNTVRIVVRPDWWDEAALRSLVAEYRAAGIVVMLDAHSYWDSSDPDADAKREQIKAMWRKLAPEYRGDSGVWFNVANEPGYQNDDWVEFNDELISIVRQNGGNNIVVVDAPTWGQDLGSYAPYYLGTRFAYSPTMAPALQARWGNVVLGEHNYGARYTTPALYGAYVDAVHGAGLPLVQNEFGYSMDGSTTAGSYDLNRAGAKAVLAVDPSKGVGTIVWNANAGDSYSLKSDRSPWYSGGPDAKLSELGRDMWALTH